MSKLKKGFFLLVGIFSALVITYLFFPLENGIAAGGKKSQKSNNQLLSGPPNFDALSQTARRPEASLQSNQQIEGARVSQSEPRFDVPTFLWATNQGEAINLRSEGIQRKTDEAEAAKTHLGRFANQYRLNKVEIASAKVASVHDTGKGAIIVKLRQNVNGVEVFRDEINVIMNRNLQLIAISGYLTGDTTANVSADFNIQPENALATAIQDLTGASVESSSLRPLETPASAKGADNNPYLLFTADNNSLKGVVLSDEPSRVKKVMFHLPEGYVPAYYVETSVMVQSDETLNVNDEPVYKELGYSYVISAVDGQLLFRNNLVAEQKKATRANLVPNVAYSYRVWADPTTLIPYDTPAGNSVHPKINPFPDGAQYPFASANLITLQNYPFSKNDPWLPAGATDTNGNNVDAFVNLTNPDGYGPIAATPYDGTSSTGDFRANITAPGVFDHLHVADASPATAEARQGSVQQLFYNINFLHDWFYDAGFDEASGNAQTDNFGRGGLGGDNIKGQSQDVAGRNNANMLTPADGGRPRMRMYLFDTNAAKYVDVLSPASIAGKRGVGTGQFGAQVFDLTNQVVQPSPAHGCTAASFTGTAGKIVMVDREPTATCSIGTKLNNAMTAGAVGFILVNLSTTPDTVVNVTGSLPTFTIPFVSITWNGAAGIKTQLAASQTVTVRLRRDGGADRDGSLDNQIVSHEWGHYISNRLVGNANGLNSNLAGGLGEGWGDFTSMLLTVRPDDTTVPSNANWNGVYAMATYATSGGVNGEDNQGYYWGIRRVPYSTDMTKNGLTYKHIANGNALPSGIPTGFGTDGSNNSEVHNTGEVWTTMLWECYAALLRDTQGSSPRLTFQQAQDRMKNYLVAAYKMTPVSPTLLEARDAVLAAAFTNDPIDGQLFAQAFAKRGAGTRAVSPDRYSTTNVGVVESFTVTGDLAFVGASLDDSLRTYDNDGYLDSRELGVLKITVKNAGMAILNNTTATVTSTNPDISFPNGASVSVPPLQPFAGDTTVSIVVEAGNMFHTLQTANFNITVNDPANPAANIAPISSTFSTYVNADEILNSSATDTVEAKQTPWTVTSNPSLSQDASAKWRRNAVGSLNYVWYGPNPGFGSDQYLTSPVVTVNGSGSVNMQFDHSYSFEFDASANYDGGVVEMSVNGGAWTDIGASAYNGTLATYAGNVNPLAGRPAFVKNSAGTIHTSLTQAIAPGSTVQFRFRIGTDGGVGADGWQIDNIALSGISGTPFTTLVAELTPTAAAVQVEGRVLAEGSAISRAVVSYVDNNGVVHSTKTNSFGYYRFTDVAAGNSYVFSAKAKGFSFPTRIININEAINDLDFNAE